MQWNTVQLDDKFDYSDDWGFYTLKRLYDTFEGGETNFQGWELSLDNQPIGLNQLLNDKCYGAALEWASSIIKILYIKG